MQQSGSSLPDRQRSSSNDEWVFGWDPTPGIVSVWASRDGHALVWRREGEQVLCTRERFRPWLFATTLSDLAHLGPVFPAASADLARETTPISYHVLDGPEGAYRYLLSARDGRFLERELLKGASQRLGRQIKSLGELSDTYYVVGPVEQYLMQTGRVYFLGLLLRICTACSSIWKPPRLTLIVDGSS